MLGSVFRLRSAFRVRDVILADFADQFEQHIFILSEDRLNLTRSREEAFFCTLVRLLTIWWDLFSERLSVFWGISNEECIGITFLLRVRHAGQSRQLVKIVGTFAFTKRTVKLIRSRRRKIFYLSSFFRAQMKFLLVCVGFKLIFYPSVQALLSKL